MVSITISIPEEVRRLMKRFPDINWSGFVRKCISERAKELEIKEEMLKQFKHEKDFNEWSVNIIREGRHKK